MLSIHFLGPGIDRFLGVSVVGGDENVSANLQYFGNNFSQAPIDRFNGSNSGLHFSGMTDHVSVGKVDQSETVFSGAQSVQYLFFNDICAHLGDLVISGN